ncbi:MAG: extracellular solute-binding protein [Clostridia bacterium]|nr:extracellular solute-binding protein [Clostridia bacterium]
MKKRLVAFLVALALVLPVLPLTTAAKADELPYGLPELEITSDTVTYLTWDSAKNMQKDPANLLMQEIYGCKLKVVRTTYAELPGKAVNLRLAGNTPDLIKFRNQEFPGLINNDVVMDVTEYLDFSDPLYADLKGAADAYAYQGRYYAFPSGELYNNNYLYYWTSYFEDQGLDTPMDLYEEGEWTFSAMREMMKDLTIDEDRDGIIDIYGLVLHPIYSFSICGEDFVTYDPETGLYANNLRSPALAEYFDFLYNTSTAGDDTRLMSQEDISCFAAKNAVMMLGERWVMSEYYDDILEGRVGVAPAPRMDSTDVHYAQGRVDQYWIGKNCSNLNGALAYLACQRAIALNPDLARELAERAGEEYNEWPEEYKEFRKELMNDPERFTLLLPRYAGVGTWGDDTFGFWDLSSKITQFELPWQTVMEEHYPLLQESINQANGAYNPQ